MKAKRYVLKRHPDWFAWSWRDCWVIYAPTPHYSGNTNVGSGKTARQAWEDAAKALKKTAHE